MKVSMVGSGYVGLVSATCFAEFGHQVTCIDIDSQKIQCLKNGQSPIFEPGLSDLLQRNIAAGRLHFSTDYSSVAEADFTFLAVGTPTAEDGQSTNLEYLHKAMDSVIREASSGAIVVVKSTVPVGTMDDIQAQLKAKTPKKIFLLNNPEFLREGQAVNDFMNPDRIIIGHGRLSEEDEEGMDLAMSKIEELYLPLMHDGRPIYRMSYPSAELSKYASNAFLATKISFINEMSRLCDLTGADIEEVRRGMASDVRIGSHFLEPGPGYGGSCFPKDIRALRQMTDLALDIVTATERVNECQKTLMFEKIKRAYSGDLAGRCFAFWGVAFKPDTNDIRESPAISMVEALVKAGATVRFYDPAAMDNFVREGQGRKNWEERVFPCGDKMDCLAKADGLVLMTKWREFKNPDWPKVKRALRAPLVFDTHNIYSPRQLTEAGFQHHCFGRRSRGGGGLSP